MGCIENLSCGVAKGPLPTKWRMVQSRRGKSSVSRKLKRSCAYATIPVSVLRIPVRCTLIALQGHFRHLGESVLSTVREVECQNCRSEG